jgi:hypothetical protein
VELFINLCKIYRNRYVSEYSGSCRPNLAAILIALPKSAKYFCALGLCSGFFSVTFNEESRFLFVFAYDGCDRLLIYVARDLVGFEIHLLYSPGIHMGM